MAKMAVYRDTDPSAPQDVRQFRKSSLEFHLQNGTPVILKQRWTERDVASGEARRCPYDHDMALRQSRQWDSACFGTGYLGGFRDGIITYVTIADTQEDKIRVGATGELLFERKPQLTAPWIPNIGTGDLIILADFDAGWKILDLNDRYLISQTTNTTVRGFDNNKLYTMQHSCTIELLPHTHEFYNVPIEFDFTNLPTEPSPAPGVDPHPSVPTPFTDYIVQAPDDPVSVYLEAEV